MTDLLTIGEPMVLFASQDADQSLENSTHFQKFLAGAELNVAVGVSRLGHSVEYITALGDDPWGKYITNDLKKLNIGNDYVSYSNTYHTGIMFKNLTTHGDPTTYYMRKNSAASHLDSSDLSTINYNKIKIAHITGIFLATSEDSLNTTKKLIANLNQNHIPITFDPNLRPALWPNKDNMVSTLNSIAKHATIILPGINEAKQLTKSDKPEEIAQFYFNQSTITQAVIIKLGASGAQVITRSGVSKVIPGFPAAHVVDTVGAGDGFATGVISGILDGKSLEEATLRGNAIGSLAVQSHGDNTGYPTPQKLNVFMKG